MKPDLLRCAGKKGAFFATHGR